MFKLVSKINAWMRASFEHKVSNNDLNLQLCGKSHSFGHEHKRDNTFSLFHPSVSALTFYPPFLEWHEWFLSTLELLSRGNLECLRFGASIAWMPHLLFMASLDLLFFHSRFVVEDCLEPTSHIHDILGSSTKNKTTGQQQNKQKIAWILQHHSLHPRKAKQNWYFSKDYLFFRQSPFLNMIDFYYKNTNLYCRRGLDSKLPGKK